MPTPRRWLERPDGDVRASHAERDEALQALIVHWSDGRIDEATFDQRAARARAAVTRRDLSALLRDLPPLAVPEAARGRWHRRPPRHRMGVLRATAVVLLALVVLQAVVGATVHAVHGVPWLAVALLGWLVLRGRSGRRHHRHLRA